MSAVAEHYGDRTVGARVIRALDEAGVERRVDWSRLRRLDQFHAGGLPMTRRMAEHLQLSSASQVLDVGAGLGGPDRFIAATFGCQLTGVDLTAGFVELATLLSERTGLAEKTSFRQGSATELPFPDQSFDRVLSQHVAMNVPDRARFYGDARRVLRTGGLAGFHDVTQGRSGAVRYRVPWARRPETSFLLTAEETRSALARAGLREVSFSDVTAESIEMGRAAGRQIGDDDPMALGLDLVMGPEMAEMGRNLQHNLEEGRARVIQIVVRRD